MSIQELRARIVKLDADIDLQSKLLRTLERDRSLVQSQLNATIDPMARLPFEISSEIFLQSLAPFPEPGAHHIPILLRSICHAWADIALATPALWAAIHINFPCARGMKEVLPIWLGRARNCSLSVSLDGRFDRVVMAIIWAHGQQLKHLEISNMEGDDEGGGSSLTLSGGTGSLPSLETLVIRAVGDAAFSVQSLLGLMCLAPNLVWCHWGIGRTERIDGDENLVLPGLRRLTCGEHGTCPDADDDVLHCLSLPRLEALSISMRYVTGDSLLSFLKRSSPPLQELVLAKGLDFGQLTECLFLMPDLSYLELWCQRYNLADKLFAALAESPSLVPHLGTLVVHLADHDPDMDEITDSFWTVLLSALAARHTQFKVFRLEVPDGLHDSEIPAPEIIATINELVVDAMDVHISGLFH